MTDPHWRLLLTGPRPGAWNMACDAAVLAAVGRGIAPPTLRFYEWSPPAVSLGRHQPEPDSYAAAVLAARGIAWIRRSTGGRAVYHGPAGEELTYSIAAPIGTPPLDSGRPESCRRIHGAFIDGLGRLGVESSLAPAVRRTAAALRPASRLACFAASVPHEITAGGRKVMGSAQRRTRHAFLQHGSLPLAGDQRVLGEAWPGSLDPDRWTTVASETGRAPDFQTVAAALADSLSRAMNARLVPGVLTPAENDEIGAA